MTWIRIKKFPMRISASKLNGSYALQGNKLNWIKGNTRGWGEGGYHLFDDKLKMISKFITEFPKLGFPLVFEAELEGLLGNIVV